MKKAFKGFSHSSALNWMQRNAISFHLHRLNQNVLLNRQLSSLIYGLQAVFIHLKITNVRQIAHAYKRDEDSEWHVSAAVNATKKWLQRLCSTRKVNRIGLARDIELWSNVPLYVYYSAVFYLIEIARLYCKSVSWFCTFFITKNYKVWLCIPIIHQFGSKFRFILDIKRFTLIYNNSFWYWHRALNGYTSDCVSNICSQWFWYYWKEHEIINISKSKIRNWANQPATYFGTI